MPFFNTTIVNSVFSICVLMSEMFSPSCTVHFCLKTVTCININNKPYKECLNIQDLRFSQQWLWRILSSGIQCRVARWKSTDALEEHIASVFRPLPPGLTLTSFLLILWLWGWRWHVPQNCWLTFNRLHGTVFQKMYYCFILFFEELVILVHLLSIKNLSEL
jgi:hypothetical protein